MSQGRDMPGTSAQQWGGQNGYSRVKVQEGRAWDRLVASKTLGKECPSWTRSHQRGYVKEHICEGINLDCPLTASCWAMPVVGGHVRVWSFSLKSTLSDWEGKTRLPAVNSHKECLKWNILKEQVINLGFTRELGCKEEGEVWVVEWARHREGRELSTSNQQIPQRKRPSPSAWWKRTTQAGLKTYHASDGLVDLISLFIPHASVSPTVWLKVIPLPLKGCYTD